MFLHFSTVLYINTKGLRAGTSVLSSASSSNVIKYGFRLKDRRRCWWRRTPLLSVGGAGGLQVLAHEGAGEGASKGV